MYTANENEVIFLKDSDIAVNLSGNNAANKYIINNSIPSFELFKAKYDELSCKYSSLSDKTEFLLSVGQNAMEYHGNLLKYDTPAKESLKFSDILSNTFGNIFIKRGFTCRISCDVQEIYDSSTIVAKLYENDFIIFNYNVESTLYAQLSDIEIIRDARGEAIELSSALSSTRLSVENINTALYDENGLSNKVNFLLSTDKETVAYQGTLLKYIDSDPLKNLYLSNYIETSFPGKYINGIKKGFLFHVSAELSCLYDAENISCKFNKNDYFIFNDDVKLSNIYLSSFDVIKDYHSEILLEKLNLCSYVHNNFANLLSNNTFAGKNTFNDDISVKMSNIQLTDELSSLHDICVSIRNDIKTNYDNISSVISNLSALSSETITLSGLFIKELSNNLDAVHFKQDLNDIVPSDYELSTFFLHNLGTTDKKIHKGFSYRFAINKELYCGIESKLYYTNDYIIFNQDTNVSDLTFDKFNIIKDYDNTFKSSSNKNINSYNLIVTDEEEHESTYDKYHMVFLDGTLVLIKD